MLKNVVFLDRDGVLNRDSPDYVKTRDEFEFLSGSLDAVRLLTRSGFVVMVVTNQSMIGRGMADMETLFEIHRSMVETVKAHGGSIRDIFFCPHAPADQCDCRKPSPGLLFRARDKYDIDLAAATLVGDSARDIECARSAGCGRTILVKTGHGREAGRLLSEKGIRPEYLADDLLDAAHWLLRTHRP